EGASRCRAHDQPEELTSGRDDVGRRQNGDRVCRGPADHGRRVASPDGAREAAVLNAAHRAIPEISDDVVIVGGGLAGLFCALCLAPRSVTVLAAAPIGEGASSAWAQGGIAAAMSPGDSVEKH